MANPSGRKGTKGETDRVNYFKERGWRYATRIPKKGARDEGDIILDQAVPVMVESKETKAFTPASFIAEMEVQIVHAAAEFGFVIHKKRGTTDVGKYYALTTVEQIMSLIERVWSPSPPQAKAVPGVQVWQCGVYDEYGQCTIYAGHEADGVPHSDASEPRAFRAVPSRPAERKLKVYKRR